MRHATVGRIVIWVLAFWFVSQLGLGLSVMIAEAQDPGVWALYNWTERGGGLFDETWNQPYGYFGPHSTFNGGPPPGYFGEGGYASWSIRPYGMYGNGPTVYGYGMVAPGLSPLDTWPGNMDWNIDQ